MKSVLVIRIDPERRTIAAMKVRAVRDCTPQFRRMIRANNLGHRELMKVNDEPLLCVGGLDVDEAMKGWRLRGCDDHAGIGLLTGHDKATGLLVNVPVTVAWLRDRVLWLDGEDTSSRETRADEMLPSLNDDVRRAIREAFPIPGGDIWLTAAHKAIVGEAMQTLGLGTERSGGQMLTKLGETVHDLLISEKDA